MKSKLIIASIFVLASACKQDAPPAEAPVTATQTAVQAVEKAPSVFGAEFMEMSDEGLATIIKSGDAAKVRDLIAFRLFEFGNAAGEGSVGPFEVGKRKVEQPLAIGLRQSRMLVAKLGGAPSDCDLPCQNTHINKIVEPLAGGLLYTPEGKVDTAVLKTLVDKVQVKADDKVLGIPATAVYATFKPTLREYALVFKTLKVIGLEQVKSEFVLATEEADDDQDAMSTFYRRFVNINNVAGQAGLPKSNRHAVATGFWMRRMTDGTLPVVEETLKKTLVEFDKPLHDEVFSAK